MPWYRGIKIEEELKVLSVRDRLAPEVLQQQQQFCSEETKRDPNFTGLSAFQYLRTGIRQYVFSNPNEGSNIGIILKCTPEEPREVLFRARNRSSVSDEIFKRQISKAEFEEKLKEDNYLIINELQVRDIILEGSNKVLGRNDRVGYTGYNEYLKQNKKNKRDESEIPMPWSEALFRYQTTDIDAVVVNKDDIESWKKGYVFLKLIKDKTGRTLKLDYYDEKSCGFKHIDLNQLEEQLKNNHSASMQALYKKYNGILQNSNQRQ